MLDSRDIETEAVERWLAANPLPVGGGTADLVCRRGDDPFPLRVPLRADGIGPVGWLLLGPRPDGTFYGREERAALREIADPVARALAVAFDRERREAAHRAREEARELRLGALGRQVDALRRFVEARYGVDISR